MPPRRDLNVPRPWWKELVAAWPLVIATLTIIAFIVNAQRDIADLKYQVVVNGGRIQSIAARTDTLQDDGKFRDLVLCQLLQHAQTHKPLPRKCEDVFHGWGYP